MVVKIIKQYKKIEKYITNIIIINLYILATMISCVNCQTEFPTIQEFNRHNCAIIVYNPDKKDDDDDKNNGIRIKYSNVSNAKSPLMEVCIQNVNNVATNTLPVAIAVEEINIVHPTINNKFFVCRILADAINKGMINEDKAIELLIYLELITENEVIIINEEYNNQVIKHDNCLQCGSGIYCFLKNIHQSKTTIRPVIPTVPQVEGIAREKCGICYEKFEKEGEDIYRVSHGPGHFFHIECLDKWFNKCEYINNKYKCPECGIDISK